MKKKVKHKWRVGSLCGCWGDGNNIYKIMLDGEASIDCDVSAK